MSTVKAVIYTNLGRATRYTYPLAEIVRDISSVKTVIGVFSKENNEKSDPKTGVGKLILDNWKEVQDKLEFSGIDASQKYDANLKEFIDDNLEMKFEQVVLLATDMMYRARTEGFRHFYLDISSGRRMLAGLVMQSANYILDHREHSEGFEDIEFSIVTRPVDSKKEAKNPVLIETPDSLEQKEEKQNTTHTENSIANRLVVQKLPLKMPPILDFEASLILLISEGLGTHKEIREKIKKVTNQDPPATGKISNKINEIVNKDGILLLNKRGPTNSKSYQRTNLGDAINDFYKEIYFDRYHKLGLLG